MTDNDQLLENIGKMIKLLQEGQGRLEKRMDGLETTVGSMKCAVETLKAGQVDIRETVKHIDAGLDEVVTRHRDQLKDH